MSQIDHNIAVIGLGYVGLPLAVALAWTGHQVTGLDVDARKIDTLQRGASYIPDVPDDRVAPIIADGRFRPTTNPDALREVDAIFICVPTPFDAMRAPDLAFIRSAAESIVPRLRAGQLVVLQSTTYPGTTEEFVQPILERTGLKGGVDFDLAFVPERIDPGNKVYTVVNTPKVVGGLTERGTQRAAHILADLGAPVKIVSTPRAAEMTKLLENIFRSVNIALVNELALLSERMGIDIWEVIDAASTKPFGFMPFRPGAGVGGHCIPVDPYYLSWKAREYDFYTKFIELAAEVNQAMPFHTVNLVAEALSIANKALHGAHVLILGVAFKRDVDDARNSPAERVIELLLERGARVSYHDPYVPRFHVGGDVFHRPEESFESMPLTDEAVTAADCVLIVTGHTSIDYQSIAAKAKLIVDTCNVAPHQPNVVRLGAPS